MRGQRFEQREQRTAEQAGLLAGDDGDRAAIGEQLRRPRARAAARRGAPAARAITAAISSRRRSCACVRAIAAAQAPRSAGSPEKNGATDRKSYA